jgi:hypothetical protein
MKKNENYFKRFCNKENEVESGIFNSQNWGKRTTIMTPKEKAIELVDRFKIYCDIDDPNGVLDWECCLQYNSKKCALIAVDEIVNCDSFFKTLEETKEFTEYWYNVQNEINNL